jgi:hypothetical protein
LAQQLDVELRVIDLPYEFGFKASRLWTKSKPSLYALLPR